MLTKNNQMIGELIMDVDGYFYFWSTVKDGCWPSYILRYIADKLDEINKDWDNKIKEELK